MADKEELKVGVYVCHCGVNIAGTVDVEEVAGFASSLPEVKVAKAYRFMCSDPGQQLIRKDIRENGINRVIVAACSPLLHERTFRRVVESEGLNPFYFQMANIREQDSWVTKDGEQATEKAKALVRAAVKRVLHHQPLEVRKVPVNPDVLVVGGGIAGIQAALTCAESGKKVYLVEREPSIGGHMAQLDKTFPTLDCSACILTPKMTDVGADPNIELLTYSEVESVDGYVGNFSVKVRKKARRVTDECTGCTDCEDACPVTVLSEFDEGLRERKAIYRPFPQAVPNIYTISRKGVPACQASCPIHQNAYGYIALIAKGKYEEALDVILWDNPLPASLGRVCSHPCEEECPRNDLDQPLAIRQLKRFVTDQVGDWELPKPEEEREERVAIVGSGPAGLACAYDLRQKGYQVTIYEALEVAGGVLAVQIPDYRLPKDILRQEIQRMEDIGVKIRLSAPVGEAVTLKELKEEGATYNDAVFLAIGAPREKKTEISGEELKGVLSGTEFLKRVNLNQGAKLGKRVVVAGGGDLAIDAARTAKRVGAEDVIVVCPCTQEEMPAHKEEVEEAEREGIKVELLARVAKVLGDRKVEGIECVREVQPTVRPQVGQGEEVEGQKFTFSCDSLIIAIDQMPDIPSLNDDLGLEVSPEGSLIADELTLQTNVAGVFAGGACVTGPTAVIDAMAAGRKAAESIHRYINGLDMKKGRELEGPYKSVIEVDISREPLKERMKPENDRHEVLEQRGRFDEINLGFTEELAKREADRCLKCAICCDCRLCWTVCEPEAIDYSMEDEIKDIKVGTIILATGFKAFDPRQIPYYGYGRYDNVITSLEFERMLNATGPTGGRILLKDGTEPKSIGIIHCVGSRDENYNPYCSKVCCMYSLKFAHLAKERTAATVYNFYIDMRTFGKGYEEFYRRVRGEGARFIRGIPSEITQNRKGKLHLVGENIFLDEMYEYEVDMLILAVGLEPREDMAELARMFNLSRSPDGFLMERHPKLAPVSTFTDGVFLAGTCQGPKDIPDSVAQAGAAASYAVALADKGTVTLEAYAAHIDEEFCSGCRTCIGLCPFSAIGFDEERKVAVVNEALCKGCGTCVAACPSGAATQYHFTSEQIMAELEGVLT